MNDTSTNIQICIFLMLIFGITLLVIDLRITGKTIDKHCTIESEQVDILLDATQIYITAAFRIDKYIFKENATEITSQQFNQMLAAPQDLAYTSKNKYAHLNILYNINSDLTMNKTIPVSVYQMCYENHNKYTFRKPKQQDILNIVGVYAFSILAIYFGWVLLKKYIRYKKMK